MEGRQNWQDGLNLILGVWLAASPFLGIGETTGTPAWNAYVFGAIVVVISAVARRWPRAWEELANLLVGLWLIWAPFVLGFTTQHGPALNYLIVGVLIAADAVWAALPLPGAPSSQHSRHA